MSVRDDILSVLYKRGKDPAQFKYDTLLAPNLYSILPKSAVDHLYKVITDGRLSGNMDKRYAAINEIMECYGFRKFHSGTNRVVYRYLEDQSIICKVASSRIGFEPTINEMNNQVYLKPFVTKCFQVDPTGAVGLYERVKPITNIDEFISVADSVFDVLYNKLIGKYIVEDVGSKYFMNWGMRDSFGPVLLDYPSIYKLDGSKLYCANNLNLSGVACDGVIDYDPGFNHLVCNKCGRKYQARELREKDSKIIIRSKGKQEMKVKIIRNGIVEHESQTEHDRIPMTNVISRNARPINAVSVVQEEPIYRSGYDLKVTIRRPGDPEVISNEELSSNDIIIPSIQSIDVETTDTSHTAVTIVDQDTSVVSHKLVDNETLEVVIGDKVTIEPGVMIDTSLASSLAESMMGAIIPEQDNEVIDTDYIDETNVEESIDDEEILEMPEDPMAEMESYTEANTEVEEILTDAEAKVNGNTTTYQFAEFDLAAELKKTAPDTPTPFTITRRDGDVLVYDAKACEGF